MFMCTCVRACMRGQFFQVEGPRGLRVVMWFVKKPDSSRDEAGPAPVCFKYRGSISSTRGQDLKAGAEVMS